MAGPRAPRVLGIRLNVKLDQLAHAELLKRQTLECGGMKEEVIAATLRLDEPKPPVRERLDSPAGHTGHLSASPLGA